MLAELAAPEKKLPSARDLDGLADDIATLSYESALKTNALYRPSLGPATEAPRLVEVPPVAPEAGAPVASARMAAVQPAIPRKLASVTVRLTRVEDEQLRLRAAEAGMTISAYLRSCAFEVETLRAQVKQTIAEMRHAEAPKEQRKGHFSGLFAWRKRSDHTGAG
jgi:hypothetical protein